MIDQDALTDAQGQLAEVMDTIEDALTELENYQAENTNDDDEWVSDEKQCAYDEVYEEVQSWLRMIGSVCIDTSIIADDM